MHIATIVSALIGITAPSAGAAIGASASPSAATSTSSSAIAERYHCQYRWTEQGDWQTLSITVAGQHAVVDYGLLSNRFVIAGNSATELLLYEAFTKASAGADYPVGLVVIVLDKKSLALTYSNTFAGAAQNGHASGGCTSGS